MNIIEYPDREMLAIDLANQLAEDLKTHLLHHDRALLAVPGGTSPGPVFDALCAADLDWGRVCILPTDERCVPPDHDRSNARLIAQRLMQSRAASARLLPLYVPSDASHRPEDALPELESRILPDLPIAVLLLGMGTDMHTASLFPHAPGLREALSKDAPLLNVMRPETQPETRISLSARALNGALHKHLILFGSEKRFALDKALSLPPEGAPIQAVLSEITVHYAH